MDSKMLFSNLFLLKECTKLIIEFFRWVFGTFPPGAKKDYPDCPIPYPLHGPHRGTSSTDIFYYF